jgi:hypothetical protein
MRPGTDSLNVAVAAGIFLYHFQQPGLSGATNMSDADHLASRRDGEQGD